MNIFHSINVDGIYYFENAFEDGFPIVGDQLFKEQVAHTRDTEPWRAGSKARATKSGSLAAFMELREGPTNCCSSNKDEENVAMVNEVLIQSFIRIPARRIHHKI